MRFPKIAAWLRRRLVPPGRAPDVIIGGPPREAAGSARAEPEEEPREAAGSARAEPEEQVPYLRRWFLIPRNRVFNVYLHHFCRSDDDRALHDHPWWNVSFLLSGTYVEHTIRAGGINVMTRREAGAVKLRGARAAHRIELTEGPCWTLFVTGPRIRRWGFHCPRGWRHWKEFTQPADSGQVGRGCE